MEELLVNGPKDTSEIPHKPIGSLLMDVFSAFDKNTIAVVNAESGESLTYAQLYQMSKNLATSLRLLGVTKNDIIGLVAENSAEFLVVYLAALFIAVPVHLINPKFTPYELRSILELSEPSVFFCTKKTHQNAREVARDLDYIKIVICLDVEKMLPECIQECDSFKVEENIDTEEHIAVICNSSGTTGLPKGAMINHEALRLHFINGRSPDFFDMRFGEKHLLILPFFHVYGLCVVNGVLFTGGTIIPLGTFEPDLFLTTIQKYKIKLLLLVPTLINFFVKSPLIERYDLSCVTRVTCGGSCLPEEDANMLRNRLNLERLGNGYGMTEAGIILFTYDNCIKSVGKVLWGYQMKVVDLEEGHDLPPFQNGEICVKGAIMKGYIRNVEKTKEIIDCKGFLHSGDLGYYDEDGYFYINGRIKEIIKYKSYQVSPNQLEQVLLKFIGIKDVAVVGKPDGRFGELPTAAVVKEDGVVVTEKEICDYLAELVSEEKQLHGGVRFVQTIPRNSLGKILRYELVKQLFSN